MSARGREFEPQPAPSRRPTLTRRPDHALLVAGSVVMIAGALLPWLRGPTRIRGYVDWTRMSDAGDGGILVGPRSHGRSAPAIMAIEPATSSA